MPAMMPAVMPAVMPLARVKKGGDDVERPVPGGDIERTNITPVDFEPREIPRRAGKGKLGLEASDLDSEVMVLQKCG
jgi:hypothetical protein